MTIARKIDGTWQAFTGAPRAVSATASTRIVTYADGRREEEACEPYPVEVTLDPGKVAQLVADGVWDTDDLAPYGLRVVEPFAPPEGKHIIGAASYVEDGDTVREVYEVEDIPPPPPPPTALEKLAAAGLTVAELKALVAS